MTFTSLVRDQRIWGLAAGLIVGMLIGHRYDIKQGHAGSTFVTDRLTGEVWFCVPRNCSTVPYAQTSVSTIPDP